MKKVFEKVEKIFFILLVATAIIFILNIVSFVSFRPISYKQVAAEAAKLYGIEEYEFTEKLGLSFVIGGKAGYDGEKFFVEIDTNGVFRSIVISNIFHEFAHLYQIQNKLYDGPKLNEKQAEVISFRTMWRNGYWWEALHTIFAHTIPVTMPAEYIDVAGIWKEVFR